MTNPVIVQFYRKSIKLYEMFECEVLFDDRYFHHNSRLREIEYHNAYDADENYTLFRADALFSYEGGTPCEVPVFVYKKEKQGSWKWLIRFRPDKVGNWTIKVRVLCWHPDYPNSSRNEPASAIRKSSSGLTYWEHKFGFEDKEEDYKKCPSAKISFRVEESNLYGPLEKPGERDNRNYFYRLNKINKIYNRRPFFLLGLARPWVVDDRAWDNYLNRDVDLFKPMKKSGCNMLYHWMAPWETQLIHQSQDEYWFTPDGKSLSQTPDGRLIIYRNARLSSFDTTRGYKRFDQGRAKHTDRIFDLAAKYDILIFLSVLSHQSLQEAAHPWNEWGWSRLHPYIDPSNNPSKINGFQLFTKPDGRRISIHDFFQMTPDNKAEPWKRRLWNHFANFWRYIIGRWTAHPAMGAWVLIDELEGVGTGTDWWWNNRTETYSWHDNLVRLLRGTLGQWSREGRELPYTSDYLHHPITSSTTHYEGTGCRSKVLFERQAMEKIDSFGELTDHGKWKGSSETVDFVSHHAYQAIPTWSRGRDGKPIYKDFLGWQLPNSLNSIEEMPRIRADRWLWDSVCMRLRNWGNANTDITRIITEYGCLERLQPGERWDQYGKRNPSFAHFANWAALVLGHAGIPLKWNDGGTFGEMSGRASSRIVWNSRNYPVDNYNEIKNVNNFLVLSKANFNNLMPYEFRIVSESGDQNRNFNAWGLADPLRKSILIWIYDRTFESRGRIINGWLEIFGALENQTYNYKWFDTWAGKFISMADRSVTSTDKGFIKIPLTKFPESSEETVKGISDGNDIAIFITISS